MLSPALWELPPLQLHRTFPGIALAPDPSEDRFSIRRQWKPLCLVPTCSSLSGPFTHARLCDIQHLPSFSHLTYLALPVSSELPPGWGSSCTFNSHDSLPQRPTSSPQTAGATQSPGSLPGLSVLAAFLVPNPLSHPSPRVAASSVCFCTDHIYHLQGTLGHRRSRTLPTPLPSQFPSCPGQAAVPSGALRAGLEMAVNAPPASGCRCWD